jgi:hypothetical protein
MTADEVLSEVLARLSAGQGEPVFVRNQELDAWPGEVVQALKASQVLTPAEPAASAVCPGCEMACVMPVHVRSSGSDLDAFIVCEERDDTNRVGVPVTCLEQWQASGISVADFLTQTLGVRRSGTPCEKWRWEVGVFKGTKPPYYLFLEAKNGLVLTLAGNAIPLIEVLTITNDRILIDRKILGQMADRPTVAAGDRETKLLRKKRLMARRKELEAAGVSPVLPALAQEEGISTSRVKKILAAEKKSGSTKMKGKLS